MNNVNWLAYVALSLCAAGILVAVLTHSLTVLAIALAISGLAVAVLAAANTSSTP